ncbi:DUF6261 family protein [Tenacibaculum amylolyticum]|uniref:DUF6261 family protein n=1 Tax=Tenacibaculum amylolyticum TaxID=104269 RepID=UPI0038B4C989
MNAIRGFRNLATTYTYHANEAKANAAKDMLTAIDIHGSEIARRSYNEQTGILYSIVKDFETKDNLKAAITLIGASEWLTELKNSNTLFDTKYLERNDEAALNPLTDFTELRKEATTGYRELINHIEAHATLSDIGTYKELLNKISNLAKQYNLSLELRTGNNTNTSTIDNADSDSDAIPPEVAV